jgi:hypothetical protein
MMKRRGKPNGQKEVLSLVCQLDVSSAGRRAVVSRYAGMQLCLVARVGVVGSAGDRRIGASLGSVMMLRRMKPNSSALVVCG